jgi:hypothetical protein
MKKTLAAVGMALAVILSTSACAQERVQGVLVSKYIEDHTEYTLVVMEDGGDVHHFTVDEAQWRKFVPAADGTYNHIRIDSSTLEAPSED